MAETRSLRLSSSFLKRRLRPLFMAALGVAVVIEIVILMPSNLEEGNPNSATVEASALVSDGDATLANGIPRGRIPEYSVEKFDYVSTQGTERLWKIYADKAYLYNKEKIVHTRQVKALLFNPDGDATVVTGSEGKYSMDPKNRDLELFGNVKTTFPDGFEVESEYLLYQPNLHRIQIPSSYTVKGTGKEKPDENFSFVSRGADFAMGDGKITLPQSVQVVLERPADPSTPGVPDRTVIESDRAVIFRQKKISSFTMNASRPLENRFVQISQPKLYTRSRRAELNYGDFSKLLQYLVVYEDVLVKELPEPETAKPAQNKGKATTPASATQELKYATAGRADFDTRSDVIVLTEFPQAYQGGDTITGDVILLHRDTDVVEVEHSNAYSQGE